MDLNNTNIIICRVCMCHDDALKSIFALESFSEQMLLVNEVMTSCASVQMEPDDGLPQKICAVCLKHLSEAYAFKKLCEQTDSTLRNNLIIKSEEEDMQDEVEQIDITDNGLIMYEYKGNIENVSERVTNITEDIKQEDDVDSLMDEDNNEDISTSENTITSSQPKEGTSKCPTCGKYVSSGKVCHHRKLQHIFRPYTCDICNQRYGAKQDFVNHMLTHPLKKPKMYKCDICNNSYATEKDCEVHKKDHSSEKPYMCDLCGNCFSTHSDMEKHTKEEYLQLNPGRIKHRCIVPTCSNRFYFKNSILDPTFKHKHFYRSTVPKIKNLWIDKLKSTFPHIVVTQCFKVCEDHFLDSDFSNSLRTRIHKHSVPSVFKIQK